jgi:hypothetical protein
MSAEQVGENVIAELRHMPRGTVIVWGDDTSGDEAVLTGDLGVWAPALARPLGLNWVWVISAAEPAEGLGPLSIVLPAEDEWTPAFVSEVLREWTEAHTGRTDISYVYDPSLTSDWVTELAQRLQEGEANEPAVESEDGRLHSIALQTTADGRPMTECGLVVAQGWPERDGRLFFPVEMSDEEFDREWDRVCC